MIRQITQPNLSDSEEPTISLKQEIKEGLDLDEDSVLDIRYYIEENTLYIEEVDLKNVFKELEYKSGRDIEEE